MIFHKMDNQLDQIDDIRVYIAQYIIQACNIIMVTVTRLLHYVGCVGVLTCRAL